MLDKNKKQQNIISVEADAAVPDTYGLERFMEEVNILELEGYYFCPNRTKAGKIEKRTISLGELADKPVTIVLSEYGRPGERAYKVLQAVFKKLSEHRYDTDGVVQFSLRELTRLLGTSSGGRQTNQVYRAIKQLQRTEINCAVRFKEKRDGKWEKKWRAVSFTIFNRVAFEGSGKGRFSRCVIKVDDMIVRNFQNRHVSYFNWERMQGLDMVGMMLYKRLFRHMANIFREGSSKDALIFDKDYEPICKNWLGLKSFKERSRILTQLKSLNDLKEVRLLREWCLERGADGQFKIVAYPGQGFFKDYMDIYRRALTTVETPRLAPEPLLILVDFHKRLGHERDEFTPKEVAYVRELLARYTPDEVYDLMAYGLKRAEQTRFPIEWFGGLSLYEAEWRKECEKRSKIAARQKLTASCPFCNEVGMLTFTDGSVIVCPHDAQKVAFLHRQKPLEGYHEA